MHIKAREYWAVVQSVVPIDGPDWEIYIAWKENTHHQLRTSCVGNSTQNKYQSSFLVVIESLIVQNLYSVNASTSKN
jgi:hypothetical protein